MNGTSISCPNSTFSYPGASDVSQCICPVDSVWVSRTNCTCNPGFYQVGNASAFGGFQCTLCQTGSYCVNGQQIPCGAGTYQTGIGVSVCTLCAAGTYINGTGSTQCTVCPAASACPSAGVSSPVPCSIGLYQTGSGTTSCDACGVGSYQTAIGTTVCSLCSAASFSTGLGMISMKNCSGCGTGTYQTGVGTTVCSLCQTGTYNPDTACNSSSSCRICPIGYYCQVDGLASPTPCAAGSYLETTGATSASECQSCQPGTYSLSTGLTSPCPVCQANNFCLTTTEKSQCPQHTTSGNGSFSLLQCHCIAGRICVYAKRIHVVVTLNISRADFLADVGSVRTNFLQALHDAAGISVGQHAVEITINDVVPAAPTGRRLLGDTPKYIDIYATVSGVVHLKRLKHHLTRRIPEVHVAHTMQHEHKVHVMP